MSVIVTGGAGFIGSCVIRMLNDNGIDDIIIVDNINETEKWKNLVNKSYREYVHKSEFFHKLKQYEGVTHIIHMGACSSTTEKNFDYLYHNNLEFTKVLWSYCSEHGISFIYASSAATYGDGSLGFSDECDISRLCPLNGYGYSKQLFDIWARKQEKAPKQHVGLKFFNVYGPNEYCKGNMASMIMHGYNQVKNTGEIRLFKSYNTDYADGEQLRDFVYIKDICSVIYFMMQNEGISGLFNVGTGKAQSFKTLAHSVFKALNIPAEIKYIEMPEILRAKYQYYTQAKIEKLRSVGYDKKFYTLEEGTMDYVQKYLNKEYKIY